MCECVCVWWVSLVMRRDEIETDLQMRKLTLSESRYSFIVAIPPQSTAADGNKTAGRRAVGTAWTARGRPATSRLVRGADLKVEEWRKGDPR